ncbi:MAG: hypothetical protein M1825_000594 [Sarcosagium campestre]|nr:MAG: hypothetical protein M1825_000594 [Sarcosagium campestre]
MAKNIFRILDQGWTFKQEAEASDKWRPVSQLPTNVHLDLLANHEIPDPSIGKNELGVQWVGEKAWQYRTTFQSPIIPEQSGLKAVLEFHGLDTYADVVLNGTPILKTENMFIPERVDVTSLIQSQDNHLLITFSSAFLKGKKLAEKYRNHYWGCWNGDPSRLAVRKAQYHYVSQCILSFRAVLTDVHVLARVDESLESASVRVTVDTEGLARTVTIELILEGRVLASNIVTAKANSAECLFELHRETNTKDLPLKLWFPSGYGQQPLYTVTVTLSSKDGPVQSANKRFGLRRANVVQQSLADAPGKSFMFVVNDVPMFCGGSNWIPADNFIPRVSEQRYRDWIKLVVQSNQVMLRVWGGGIFEQPAFYDACDEMGILVWQDFMFACGNYPAHPEFLETVKREATANVQALRHHPSIVIWAGNNEDYQYCESEGLNYDPDDKNPEHWLKSSFPARYIYEDILPRVMKSLAPDTYYHFGSPWGGKNTRDPTVGDIHQWNGKPPSPHIRPS